MLGKSTKMTQQRNRIIVNVIFCGMRITETFLENLQDDADKKDDNILSYLTSHTITCVFLLVAQIGCVLLVLIIGTY